MSEGGVWVAKGVSGRQWGLRMVQSLTSGNSLSSSSLAVVEDTYTGERVCAKRQYAESEERMSRLVQEGALWRNVGLRAVESQKELPGCVIMDEKGENTWPRSVVRLVDCLIFSGEKSSVVFLMEYHEQIPMPRTPGEDFLLCVLSDICEGLIAIYDAGVRAHGNLRKDHIILGKDKHARLSGFGLSRTRNFASKGLILFEWVYCKAPPADLITKSTEFQNAPSAYSLKLTSILKSLLALNRGAFPSIDALRYEIAMARGLVPKSVAPVAQMSRKQEEQDRLLANELTATSAGNGKVKRRGLGSNENGVAGSRSAFASTPSAQPERSSATVPVATGATASTSTGVPLRLEGESDVTPVATTGTTPSRRKPTKEEYKTFSPSNGLSLIQSLSEKLKSKRKESSSMESLVKKATENDLAPINSKYFRYHVIEAHERKDYAVELYKVLYRRPIQKAPLTGFKTAALLHRLTLEGPLEFCQQTAKQREFLLWLERETGADKSAVGKKNAETGWITKNDVAILTQLVRLKANFHYEFGHIFLPNWSRVAFPPDKDPVAARRKTVLNAIAGLLLKAEEVTTLMLSDKEESELKISVVPTLATEITAAYTSACILTGAAPKDEQKKLAGNFTACHIAARSSLETVQAHPTAAALCREEVLMKLPKDTPNLESDETFATGFNHTNAPQPERQLATSVDVEGNGNALLKQSLATSSVVSENGPTARGPLPPRIPSRSPTPKTIGDWPSPTRSPTPSTSSVPTRRRSSVAENPKPPSSRVVSEAPSLLPLRREAIPAQVVTIGAQANGIVATTAPTPKHRTPKRNERHSLDAPTTDRGSFQPRPYTSRTPPPVEKEPQGLDSERRAEQYHRETQLDAARQPRRRDGEDTRGSSLPVSTRASASASSSMSSGVSSEDSDSESSVDAASKKRNGKESTRRKLKARTTSRLESRSPRRSRYRDREASSNEDSSSDDSDHKYRTRKTKSSKSKKEDERKKKKKKKKKKSSRRAHSSEEISHVNPNPIQDLSRLRIGREYDVRPDEIQYGELIGQGGFGSVYRGKLRGEVVAIKKAHSSVISNHKSIEEFRREVAVLCALSHPNILRFCGACTRPPHLIIITEFCGRGTLFDYLHKENHRLSWELFIKMAVDLCQGMMFLHSSNLLHRDLKSSNLMLSDNFNIKVGDFGLTRVQQSLGPMTGQCGTFQYMAPEVLGSMPYSDKADVFSFGIILWEMAAKALPYFGMEPMQVGIAVASRGLRPKLAPEWPHPIKMLMQRAWHNDPKMRPSFAQAREFLLAIPLNK